MRIDGNGMARGTGADVAEKVESLGFRPLYRQVRETLIRRLVDRVWAPGQPLPSEMHLAAELGVSQGTVRKALDEMAAENLVVRRQGRGTFVASHDEDRILFQFFKLVADDGERRFPESQVVSTARGRANAAEREALSLPRDGKVIRIRRIRKLDGAPLIVENLALPESLFPGLGEAPIPNNLYGLYASKFGIGVGRAREKLKAIAVAADDAAALGVPEGTPALLIDRLALSLEQIPVEWRVSICLTEGFHYLSELS